MQMLRDAVELKEAILAVPKVVPSLGTCPDMEARWRRQRKEDYYDGDEEEEEEDEKAVDGTNFWRAKLGGGGVSSTFCSGPFDELEEETVELMCDGFHWEGFIGKMTAAEAKKAYDCASPGQFGSVKKMKTELDPKIRDAHDITAFVVSDRVCQLVAQKWASLMVPSENIVAVPYKVNVYKKGGHFAQHRDSSEKNLVGTFLIHLGTFGGNSWENNLTVTLPDGRRRYWRQERFCCFFPDLEHEVPPLQAKYRVTFAFKIYSSVPGEDADSADVDAKEKANALSMLALPPCNGSIGVLLTHGYSISSSSLKGVDRRSYDELARLGPQVKLTIIPVIVREQYSSYGYEGRGEHDTYSCEVYPASETFLQYALAKSSKDYRVRRSIITFLCVHRFGGHGALARLPRDVVVYIAKYLQQSKDHEVWEPRTPALPIALENKTRLTFFCNDAISGHTFIEHGQAFIEHTGNDMQPEEKDSLYLQRAIVVTLAV